MPTAGMNPHRYSAAGKSSEKTPITHRIAPAFTSSISPTVTAATQRTMMGDPIPETPEGVPMGAAAANPANAPDKPNKRQPEEPAQHWVNQIRLGPSQARTGMILAEILGEPLSKKRRSGRWR